MKSLINITLIFLFFCPVFSQDLWEKTKYNYDSDMTIIEMVNLNNNIYVTRAVKSENTLYTDMTMDGFETWDTLNADITDFCSTSEGILFAREVGMFPSQRYFLKSQDNGKTWIKVQSPDSVYVYYIAVGQNPDDIPHDILYAAENGQLHASYDLGVSWIWIETPDSCDIIFLNSNGDVYGISPINSKIIRLRHGATEWKETFLQFPNENQEWKDDVYDLKFHPDGHIYVLYNEILYILKDGEDQFKKIDSPENKVVSCFCINDSGVAYVGSRLGGVHKTIDNGITWENFGLDTLSIWNIVSDSHGVLFASAPKWQEVYKTTKSTTSRENTIYYTTASNYNLIQNYPNPFNPSTTIEFTLPKSELTTLKVYNILGKKMATLVSNKLNQGNHTYQFDGKDLASGIYYYQLVAGEYREVKKMILLR